MTLIGVTQFNPVPQIRRASHICGTWLTTVGDSDDGRVDSDVDKALVEAKQEREPLKSCGHLLGKAWEGRQT